MIQPSAKAEVIDFSLLPPNSSKSVLETLFLKGKSHGEELLFLFKDDKNNQKKMSWLQFVEQIDKFAGQLNGQGVRAGCRIALLMDNSPYWECMAYAVNRLSCSVVGLNPFESESSLKHILEMSKADWILYSPSVTSETILQCFRSTKANLLSVGEIHASDVKDIRTIPFPVESQEMCVIFTSGTTGEPKGIPYTLAQWRLASEVLVSQSDFVTSGERTVSWLPLSNPYQRLLNLCALLKGVEIAFVKDPRDILNSLREIRPHFMIGVPRFFEKVKDGFEQKKENFPKFLQLFIHYLTPYILRWTFGSRIRAFMSGSAPCPKGVLEFFEGAGMPIFEAYGVSECICPISMNTKKFSKKGSVGRPVSLVQVTLSEGGEICIQSSCLSVGDGRSNSEVGPNSNIYSTGDLGSVDKGGFLWINGRKKDQIKLSTGRWVNPVKIESLIRELPFVDQVVIIGEGRKCPIAIVVGNASFALEKVQKEICKLPIAKYEVPGAWILATEGFTLHNGMMTSNLKLKRAVIANAFRDEIEKAYRDLDE